MIKRKSIMLLITYKCNLHCSYCYEPKIQNFKMSVSKAKQLISEYLNRFGKTSPVEIQFMGGEPLLEFSLIKEVSEWLWDNGFDKGDNMLFAPTNGTLLNDEKKEWFVSNKKRFTLGLSFDGDQVMQNTNRSDSYHKVDLKFFAATWPGQSVKMTISPSTVSHLAEGVSFLHATGFRYISADLAMGPSVHWNKDSLLEYKYALKKLSDYYLENPDIIPFSMLRLNLSDVGTVKPAKTCGCGEDLICIDWTGKEYACHLFSPVSLPVDKANESKLIYDFHNHQQFISSICGKCLLYNICSHCYGMNYLCTGDVNQSSPFHCKAFKILFVANVHFQMRKAMNNNDARTLNGINQIVNLIK